MSFQHRNGETTPPTINGWYAYDGPHNNAMFGGALIREGVVTRGFVLVGGDEYYRFVWEGDNDQMIADFPGKWYGPIRLPWEQPDDVSAAT